MKQYTNKMKGIGSRQLRIVTTILANDGNRLSHGLKQGIYSIPDDKQDRKSVLRLAKRGLIKIVNNAVTNWEIRFIYDC
jgi:hypothetical protein